MLSYQYFMMGNYPIPSGGRPQGYGAMYSVSGAKNVAAVKAIPNTKSPSMSSTKIGNVFKNLFNRLFPSKSSAYRYVSAPENAVINKSGKIPNTTPDNLQKSVFVTPNKYNTVAEAENALKIGSQNPTGPKASPQYRVEFNMNKANYDYAGTTETGAVEMTTMETISVSRNLTTKLK